MPRFIRGGRGAWRKIQSSQARPWFSEDGNVEYNLQNKEHIKTPKLNTVFKFITICSIIVGIIAFIIGLTMSEEMGTVAISCYIISGICLYALILSFPAYILIYRIIAIRNQTKETDEEKNDS